MQRSRFLAGRLAPVAIDTVVAIAAWLITALELGLGSGIQGPAWVNAVGAVGSTLPIALRRRWPLGAMITGGCAVVFQEALNGDLLENTTSPIVSYLLVVYGHPAYCARRRA